MGVTNLWYILDDIAEEQPISHLSGKRVAIDLSGWVVQAFHCQGLNSIKNPHLRNIFFRVSHLLRNEVFPIFVIEGKPPELKKETLQERYIAFTGGKKSSKNELTRSNFDRLLNKCKNMLNCLGVPCIKSVGEAEALCAFLNAKGIVDGVITEDSDAFLYGAQVVYKNFHIDNKKETNIQIYDLKSTKNVMKLDQQKLVALALLLGCDYSSGVPGIGKETAIKLLSELKDVDLLNRFKEWKRLSKNELFPNLNFDTLKKITHCDRCGHPGTATKHKNGCIMCNSSVICYLPKPGENCNCEWHQNHKLHLKHKTELKIYNIIKTIPEFPDLKVVQEYLNYSDNIPPEEILQWKCPNMKEFQEKASDYLHWTYENSYSKCFPLIISWQLNELCHSNKSVEVLLFKPLRILKKRNLQMHEYFEIEWGIQGNDTQHEELDGKNPITIERIDRFQKSYPTLAEEFLNKQKEKKETLQAQRKSKKSKLNKGKKNYPDNIQKITKYFFRQHEKKNYVYVTDDEN